MSTPSTAGPDSERRLRRDAERNRRRILAAAADAFAECGLAVTMDEIARRAGVGVGTVYRRFPDKELLIEALFEERIGELVVLAEAARDDPDPWHGLVGFIEGLVALLAADRGLKEVVLSGAHGRARVARARGRIAPVVDELLERAQAAGDLRPDLAGPDVGLVQVMLAAVVDCTSEVAPEAWRRMLGIVVDGLRTRRDAPSELPAGPLDERGLDRAMAAWRPPAR